MLIHNNRLSPEINEVKEFVVHAIHYKQTLKMAHHFNHLSSKIKEVFLPSAGDLY